MSMFSHTNINMNKLLVIATVLLIKLAFIKKVNAEVVVTETKQLLRMLRLINGYSGEDITSVKTLGANISINKACNPINLGAKLKLLFSTLQNCPWM